MIPWRTVTILSTVLRSLVLVSYPIGHVGPELVERVVGERSDHRDRRRAGAQWQRVVMVLEQDIDSSADFRAAPGWRASAPPSAPAPDRSGDARTCRARYLSVSTCRTASLSWPS